MKHCISDAAGATPDVLILSIEYPPKAGAGTHVFELAHGLVAFGCNVSILAPTSGEQVTRANSPVKEILVQPSAATCASAAHLSRVQGVLAVNHDLVEQGGLALGVGDPGERFHIDVDLQFAHRPFGLDHFGDGQA